MFETKVTVGGRVVRGEINGTKFVLKSLIPSDNHKPQTPVNMWFTSTELKALINELQLVDHRLTNHKLGE